jgi:hypothetical protein
LSSFLHEFSSDHHLLQTYLNQIPTGWYEIVLELKHVFHQPLHGLTFDKIYKPSFTEWGKYIVDTLKQMGVWTSTLIFCWANSSFKIVVG